MKVIIVTGSVGTGKTALSKRLAKKLGYEYIDINQLINQKKLYSGYDQKRKCKIVDINKLNKFLINLINQYKKIQLKKSNKRLKDKKIKGMIIDSHLSHYLPKKYVDLCVVTKCDLKELNKRLRKRGYNKNKIKENLECEIFDICLNEAKEAKHRIVVIDTTKGINIGEISKMSEIFHQFLTGGWKANVPIHCGKFLSVGKQSFLTNQKFAKQISQFMLKNHPDAVNEWVVLDKLRR